jgi:hypothetical protein
MSPRRNWDSPNPSLASECAPPPEPGGGGWHTRLRVRGWGSPNCDHWRKSVALCLLCGSYLGPLRFWHWQFDAPTTWLDLIHIRNYVG